MQVSVDCICMYLTRYGRAVRDSLSGSEVPCWLDLLPVPASRGRRLCKAKATVSMHDTMMQKMGVCI